MNQVKFEDVSKSYNGKTGCMCGCQGTYSVASHYGVEAANKDIGYEGYDECNDRRVKMAVNKINKVIDAYSVDVPPIGVKLMYEEGQYVAIESDTRMTAVYLK